MTTKTCRVIVRAKKSDYKTLNQALGLYIPKPSLPAKLIKNMAIMEDFIRLDSCNVMERISL